MPRTNETNRLIKDERKNSILLAALPLFALYQDKVSVDMICEKAKCSHGLLYHYFRDANNVLFNIKKMEAYVVLKEQLLNTIDNGSSLDSIYQIIKKTNDTILNAKNHEIAMMVLIINDNDKNSYKEHLTNLIKEGQKNNQVVSGKPAEICSIYINQNNGVLLKKLLQKSYKLEIPSVENLLQIFMKKTIR